MKECTICHTTKPFSDFHKNSGADDGLFRWCKRCAANRYQVYKLQIKQQKKPQRTPIEEITILTKQCVGCGVEKPLDDFMRYPRAAYVNRHPRCRECERFAKRQRDKIRREQAERERIEASLSLTWQERIEDKRKRDYKSWMKMRYGVTPERYADMLREQKARCAICGATESIGTRSSLVIDHSHVTGAVRGLLCSHCNMGLGFFHDNTESLFQALEYLRRNQWD